MTAGAGNKKWWDETLKMGIEWRKKLLKKSKLFKPFVPDDFAKIPTKDLMRDAKYWQISPVLIGMAGGKSAKVKQCSTLLKLQ